MSTDKANNRGGSIVELPLISQGDKILIDAQLLHKELKSPTRFRDWISYRIKEYEFEEGLDYFAEKVRLSRFGKKARSYHLTLDMAKELAMLERSEVGRQVRRYFILAEKRVRGMVTPLPAPDHVFDKLETRRINDRRMYPYRDVTGLCGYSRKSSSTNHKDRYWMHFVKDGDKLWITEDFARHLYYQKMVICNRVMLRNTQPVLPLDFGDSLILRS